MKSLFEKVLFEADGDGNINDPPPDNVEIDDSTGPPDIAEDNNTETPAGDDPATDMPPDLGDDYSNIDGLENDGSTDEMNATNPEENLELDEKISTVMNSNLYQRFLSMVGTISNQLSVLKDNNDIIYASAPTSLGIIESLKKLRENINLYLAYYFINNNYSKNLLFFNKCLNLLNLLNKNFEKDLKHGVKE